MRTRVCVCVCVRLSGFEIAFYHISPRLFKEICQSLLKNSASNNNKTKQKRNNKHKKKVLIKRMKMERGGGGTKATGKKIVNTPQKPFLIFPAVTSHPEDFFFLSCAILMASNMFWNLHTKGKKMKFFKNKRSPFLGRESVTGIFFFLFKLLLFFLFISRRNNGVQINWAGNQ